MFTKETAKSAGKSQSEKKAAAGRRNLAKARAKVADALEALKKAGANTEAAAVAYADAKNCDEITTAFDALDRASRVELKAVRKFAPILIGAK